MAAVEREDSCDFLSIGKVHETGISEVDFLIVVGPKNRFYITHVLRTERQEYINTVAHSLEKLGTLRRVPSQSVSGFGDNWPAGIGLANGKYSGLLSTRAVMEVLGLVKRDERTGINEDRFNFHPGRTLPCTEG